MLFEFCYWMVVGVWCVIGGGVFECWFCVEYFKYLFCVVLLVGCVV